jgi:hypothetical protein
MSDRKETLIDRAVAWCRSGERSDAEYLDREFAHTLVKNPLLFVAFRAGQRDRDAEIADLRLDLGAAGDECGDLREHNAMLRQAVAELKERNRKQDDDIIGDRSAINSKDAEIAALREERDFYKKLYSRAVEALSPLQCGGDLNARVGMRLGEDLTVDGVRRLCDALRDADKEIAALREAVRMIAPTECVECEGSGSLGIAPGKAHLKIACDTCRGKKL